MKTLLPSDTRELLSRHPNLPDGRSLAFDRYADPAAKDEERRAWFNRVVAKSPDTTKTKAWQSWAAAPDWRTTYGQLQSRLMVNMAGGVMENAGLSLDRFGMPFIPGSAVKGCARRMAIQTLLETEEAEAKAELLAQIAMVFGWGDTDWKPGRNESKKNGRVVKSIRSDLWWAMAEDYGDHSADETRNQVWSQVSEQTAKKLFETLDRKPKNSDKPLASQLPNYAGCVSFLPAWPLGLIVSGLPLKQPALGTLELDVLTCHHPKYYQKDSGMPVALDIENPIPVCFPAVAPGHVFSFVLRRLRNCPDLLLGQAEEWLKNGLEQFGLGAKTNAGYGWFDCSKDIHDNIKRSIESQAQRNEEERRRRDAEIKRKVEDQKRLEITRAEKDRLSAMTPEEQEDNKLERMDNNQLEQYFQRITKLSDPEKTAIYRLLKNKKPELWLIIRAKAEGKKRKEKSRWEPFARAMFALAKSNKEKMPK